MQVEYPVGKQILIGKGSPGVDGSGAAYVVGVHGKYYEIALRGRLFVGGTAVSGVAPGTAIGTTGAFTLYNPLGSKTRLVVMRASMGYISGTLGAGVVNYLANVVPQAAAVTGTAITAVNCLIGSGQGANGKPLTTSTLPANPTVMRPFCSLTALLASTAVQPYVVTDDVDGEFIVDEGCALTLHATAAAGATPLVTFGMTWEEVDA